MMTGALKLNKEQKRRIIETGTGGASTIEM
jgi:hypothetical protein